MHGRKWTNVLNCMKCALSSICTSVIWLQCALLSTNEWQSTCIVGKQIRLTLVIAIDLCHLDKLSRIYLRAFQPRAFQRQQNTRHSTDDAHQQHMFPYKPLRPILHQLLQACSLVQQIKKIKIKIKKVNATADEPRNLGEASLRLSVMRCRLNWHKKGAPYSKLHWAAFHVPHMNAQVLVHQITQSCHIHQLVSLSSEAVVKIWCIALTKMLVFRNYEGPKLDER